MKKQNPNAHLHRQHTSEKDSKYIKKANKYQMVQTAVYIKQTIESLEKIQINLSQ